MVPVVDVSSWRAEAPSSVPCSEGGGSAGTYAGSRLNGPTLRSGESTDFDDFCGDWDGDASGKGQSFVDAFVQWQQDDL